MADHQPNPTHVIVHKPKKAWYKKVRYWVLGFFILIIIASVASSGSHTTTTENGKTVTKSTSKAPEWDAAAVYPLIETDMTKAQAEQVIGKTSDNCTESASAGIGTTELCIYSGGFSGKGSITVDYFNDKVYSKTKTGF